MRPSSLMTPMLLLSFAGPVSIVPDLFPIRESPECSFCENQWVVVLHRDREYTPDDDGVVSTIVNRVAHAFESRKAIGDERLA